jgi:APA family basic amino acid/polyamine antiporter
MNASTQIKPSLRGFDLTIIVISLVIGMGIFRTPAEVAKKAGSSEIFFAAWIVGAIVSMIGALIFAEIGSRYPHAGGFYKIFSHCYHPVFAFMVNWITLISNAASTALVAIMGAEYIAPLLLPNTDHSTAIGMITTTSVLLLYGINMLGIRVSAKILEVLMMVKFVLIIVIVGAIFFVDQSPATSNLEAPVLFSSNWLNAFTLCFIPVFFTYGGYQQTMNFGGDIDQPKKTMPRSIITGMLVVMVIYLSVNYAYYHTLGFDHLTQSNTLAADIASMLFGTKIIKFVLLVMFLSVLAYANVSIMSNPRVYYAMAEDKVIPKIFMRVNSKTQVQQYALSLFVSIILITLYFSHSFEDILKFVMFFDSIALISAAATIFIFRKKATNTPTDKNVFCMWGFPWLPIIYIFIYTTLAVTIFIDDAKSGTIGFILFMAGIPLYYIFQRLTSKLPSND